MLAVAIIALLTPSLKEATLGLAAVTIAIWFPIILVELIIYEYAQVLLNVMAILALGTVMVSLAVLPFILELDLFEIIVLGLTPVNLSGPFYAAWRLRRGWRLASGEVLWAWVGLVWSVPHWDFHPYDGTGVLNLMAQYCRMSLVLVLLLAQYGPRPRPDQSVWAHRMGWILMECDVIVCGWYASGFLNWG
jgi:hypothetical protein